MLCMYYFFCQYCVKIFHKHCFWWKYLQLFVFLSAFHVICCDIGFFQVFLFKFPKMKCFKLHLRTEIYWLWLYLEKFWKRCSLVMEWPVNWSLWLDLNFCDANCPVVFMNHNFFFKVQVLAHYGRQNATTMTSLDFISCWKEH